MAHVRSIGSAAVMLAAACCWINAPRLVAQQGPARPTQFRSANAPRPINAPRSPRKDEVDFGID